MAACGKNDTQAQTPSRQAEPSTIESAIVDESGNMAESVEAANEAGAVQENERNETDTAETDIQNNTEENEVSKFENSEDR